MNRGAFARRLMEMGAAKRVDEGTQENVQILTDIVHFVVKCLPAVFPAEGYGEEIPNEVSGFTDLLAKYSDENTNHIIQKFGTIPVKWFNESELLAENQVAAFIVNGDDTCVAINIGPFVGEIRQVSLEEILALRDTHHGFKSFVTMLMHELRHVIQFCTMGNYYHVDTFTYDRDPMEIDAFWTHTLHDHKPTDFQDASQYADAVMTILLRNKTLDPGQRTHYHRKTMRYWYDAMKDQQDQQQRDEKQRLKRQRRDAYLAGQQKSPR